MSNNLIGRKRAMIVGRKLYWVDEAESIFSLIQGALERSKAPIAVVFIKPLTEEAKVENEEVLKFIRNSDLVFHDPEKEGLWAVLPNSGKKEVQAFLKRLKSHFSLEDVHSYKVLFTEVRDSKMSLMEVVKIMKSSTVDESPVHYIEGPWTITEKSTIKVSLIVNDKIVQEVLHRSISTMNFKNFLLDVRLFEDGLEFESSEWYTSANHHLVVLDDVLPKKNGIEVVHFLRNQASHQKFHIFMLTDRVSEENLINAYQMGIDEVIHKPFNLRLFEALFRRTIERLWFE